MHRKKILLITFPVDLGNRTLEANQQFIFKDDMDFYRFAHQHAKAIDTGRVGWIRSMYFRAASAIKLRRIVKEYTSSGSFILFNGLSPALFSFGIWKPNNVAIVFDWTRTLYPYALGNRIKQDWIFKLHRKVLNRCPKFLCWTDAIMENLHEVYGIKKSALYKVNAPFLPELLNIPPRSTPAIPRVLFIGGDLERKGGDVILKYWETLRNKCTLTMMTNDESANVEGVNFLPGIKYGSEKHKKAFEEHDILLLPTRIDAYPQVVGEAAAAGLAVITTKYALGANEVVINNRSGFIANSPEDCISLLYQLIDNSKLIDCFKNEGYLKMHKKFAKEETRKQYLQTLLNDTH